jgi:hypothetical protein
MENPALKASTRMAVCMGVVLPLAETLRRSNQLLDPARFLNWFDDYLLGGALLLAAYWVKRQKRNAGSWLIAAWGICVGALSLSFLGQFEYYFEETGDPGIFSTTLVAVVKGLLLAYMCYGLYLSVEASAAKARS